MQYIKKDTTIYRIEDIGTPLLIATEKIDEMTKEPVMETKENPVYIVRETYREAEFTPNIIHDLADAQSRYDEALNNLNALKEKINLIKQDLPELSLPDV